nr:hypothetical protein [Tanacetum cinerariifolium]
WIRKFVDELGVVPSNNYPIEMNCDNTAVISMAKELGIMKGARHFQRKSHYVRECVETGEIDMVKVHTDDNLADPEHPIEAESLAPIIEEDVVEVKKHSLGDKGEPANLPPGAKVVKSKWIYKKKTDMDGVVYIYKARLVAKGFTQTYGVDYEETFSPVADIRAIRILIAIAAYYDYEIWQMDVKTAFLNGFLDEEICMEQPEGFVDPGYPRKASGSNVIFLILYVDEIILMGNYKPSLQEVKDYLGKCFSMKDLGDATYILGIKIYRDRSRRLIGLSQYAYLEKILKRYRMDGSKRGAIPMQVNCYLDKSQCAKSKDDKARMQNVPDDTKSQTGYVFTLNGGAVVWKSSKQSTTAQHAAEAEYITAAESTKEAVWIRKFVDELGVVPSNNYPIEM